MKDKVWLYREKNNNKKMHGCNYFVYICNTLLFLYLKNKKLILCVHVLTNTVRFL